MDTNQTPSLNSTTGNSFQESNNRHFLENDEYLESESWGRIFIPIVFGIIMVLGVSGNSLVIYSFIMEKRMRSLTNTLILNLAIADLLFLVICIPLTAFRFIALSWPFGDIGCKLSQYCVYVSVYVSIFTLVLMAVSRYFAIVHPLSSIRFRTKRNIVIAIMVTWIACLAGHIHALIQYRVYYFNTLEGERSICENYAYLRHIDKAQIFFTVFCVLGYVLPLTVITVLYGLIVKHVLNTKDPNTEEITQRNEVKRRAAKVIVFVVATFAICWLPFHAISLARKYGAWPIQTTDEINAYVSILLTAKCIAYANSCMNPILYAFLSDKFRRTFKEALCCIGRKYQASYS